MKSIQIREVTRSDATHIFSLDIRGFDNVWTSAQWQAFYENPNAKVWTGCVSGTPVSFLALEERLFLPPGAEDNESTIHIHKLTVRESFRRKGFGTRLMAFAHEQARQAGVQWVTMTVPAWMTEKKHQRYCLDWINRFRFVYLRPFPQTIHMYGVEYDQYCFGYKMQ